MKKHLLFSITFLFVFTLVLTACGGGADVPKRPIVQLKVGDQTYEETVYSYCWPKSADNLACDLNEETMIQPHNLASVKRGEEVRFVLAGDEAGPPQAFTATLLDGPGSVQNLGATNDAPYTIQLATDGMYRVRVDAQYDDVEGQSAYVSYVFGLNVEGQAAVAALPTPTLEGTGEAVEVPTEEPTQVLTEEATEEPTPTEEPSATPTRKPTLQPTPTRKPTLVPPDAEVATEDAVTAEVEVTEEATQEESVSVEPAATEEEAATEDVAEVPTEEMIATEEATPTRAVTLKPSPTPITASPTALATLPPLPSSTPTGSLVTATPTQIPASPSQAVGPTTTVPSLVLTFAGNDYGPVGYQFCERAASGERICVDLPANTGESGRITFLRGAAVQLQIGGDRPTEIRIEYLSDTGTPTGQPEVRPGDNMVLLAITPEPGTYILAVRVNWGTQDASYFFRVAVTD